jgi:hypothetical protein
MITPGPEFGDLFHSFEHTAFRLETRDQYKSTIELQALRQFVAGEPVDMGWFQDWLTMIREATAEGRRFTRVRVVSMPLTDYSRFGVLCSQHTNAAGEDIRYLTHLLRSPSSKMPARRQPMTISGAGRGPPAVSMRRKPCSCPFTRLRCSTPSGNGSLRLA